MADRTNEKTNGARPGAGSTASLEDEMPDAAGDLPEDEPELDAEDEPFDESDDESGADDAPASRGRALAVSEDEDLRLTPYEASVGGSGSAVARSSTRGLAVPQWMLGNAFTRFLAESYLELRKVTWPEFLVARNMTFIVIGMSVFVAIVLGAADYGLTQAVQWVIIHAAPAVNPAATPTPLPTGP